MCITTLWKQWGSHLHIAHTLAIPIRVLDTFQMQWIRWVSGFTVNTECSADLLQTEEQMCEVSEIASLFADLWLNSSGWYNSLIKPFSEFLQTITSENWCLWKIVENLTIPVLLQSREWNPSSSCSQTALSQLSSLSMDRKREKTVWADKMFFNYQTLHSSPLLCSSSWL